MKKYLITSTAWPGEIELVFNTEGFLVHYHCRAELPDRYMVYLLERLPLDDSYIGQLQTPNTKITLVKADLSFDAFWQAYGHKNNKPRAERLWQHLSERDRLLALQHIPVYDGQLANSGYAKKYPDTYLKLKPWNDKR